MRGIVKLILKLIVKLNPPGMHYSFGDKDARVLPHVVLPLARAVDRLIVTLDDDAPPELGLPLEVRRPSHALRYLRLCMHLPSVAFIFT